jgi:hypothetical protein
LENLKYSSPIIKEIISKNISCKAKLVVLDLGCSGGPDHIFVDLNNSGQFIDYYGYDFNDEDIKRLSKEYPSNFKFYSKKIVTERQTNSDLRWWDNFSAGQASFEADVLKYSESEIQENNFWSSDLVSKSKEEINLKEILENIKFHINVLKIDLDGPDYAVMQDFFAIEKKPPQFVSLEINYQGGGDSELNTFHNTDRYMKNLGYNLMAISNRTYSNKKLPSMFQYNIFAQTIRGIPFQGDALYFRTSIYKNADELIRDVVLLDAFKLEDQAANILIENSNLIHSEERTLLLNVLTREVWGDKFKSYSDLMKMWEENKEYFFPELPKLSNEFTTDYSQIRIKKLFKILVTKVFKKIFVKPFQR